MTSSESPNTRSSCKSAEASIDYNRRGRRGGRGGVTGAWSTGTESSGARARRYGARCTACWEIAPTLRTVSRKRSWPRWRSGSARPCSTRTQCSTGWPPRGRWTDCAGGTGTTPASGVEWNLTRCDRGRRCLHNWPRHPSFRKNFARRSQPCLRSRRRRFVSFTWRDGIIRRSPGARRERSTQSACCCTEPARGSANCWEMSWESRPERDFKMNDSTPPPSSNGETGSAVLDRAIGALKAGHVADGPPPLLAERTLAALWAEEVRTERVRSRWVIRLAAAVVLGVCAVATS